MSTSRIQPHPKTDGDDLDAFLSAADSANAEAMRRAANNVAAGAAERKGLDANRAESGQEEDLALFIDPSLLWNAANQSGASLAGKFVAVETKDADKPFVLIPAHIHAIIPWWTWAAIGASLAMIIAGVMFLPSLRLGQLAERLGDSNQSVAHAAMREFALSGDERAVTKLHGLASSPESAMPARLRAIDTLGLIQTRSAENALRRLELSERSEPPIREAASAARKRHSLDRDRTFYR